MKTHYMLSLLCLLCLACLMGCGEMDGQRMSGTQFGALVADISKAAGVKDQDAARWGRIATSSMQATTGFRVEEELAIGQGVALAAFTRIGPLHQDRALYQYVNLVGTVCGQTSDRPDLPYKFAVIDSPHVNAFAGPGGYIFVTTGALRIMKNEAELAGVLSHEIAHVTQKHSLKTLQRAKFAEAGMDAAGNKYKGKYGQWVDMVNDVLFVRGLDKNMEFEADRYGTEFAYRAGYHPAGLRDFLVTFQRSHGGGQGWLSTHPDTGARVARLSQQLRAQMPNPRGYSVLPARFRTNCLARVR